MQNFSERLLRFVATLTASVVIASLFAQYQVLIGDRDQERGVVAYNPSNNTLTTFGSCPPRGIRYYYGVDVRIQDSTVWVCDILARQIVVLDHNGNCLTTISTSNFSGVPTGISIDPTGRYANVTFQNNIIACYDISNIYSVSLVSSYAVANAIGLYGLQWSPGGVLYVCDFGGSQLIALGGTPYNLTEVARTPTHYNPYDVAVKYRTGGRAPIDELYVTETSGYYGAYSYITTCQYAYDTPGYLPNPNIYLSHPQTGNGNVSFFGIALAPDNTLWVNDYVRGELYQVTLSATPNAYLRYNEPDPYKYGLGVALAPRCVPNNGDIDGNCVVDDADLLTLLFNFGQSGFAVPGDLNCDGIVDDADLLQLLFNFGWSGGDMC